MDLIKKAACNLAGFLVDKGHIKSDAKFSIKGIKTGDKKTTMSFALNVNGEVYGHYKAYPGSKKSKKQPYAKGWGAIKDGSKIAYFDFE